MEKIGTIKIYPVKSLEGLEVEEAKITEKGALEHDREFALIDEHGKFVNAKKYPSIHLIKAEFNLKEMYISLSVNNSTEQSFFSLYNQQNEIGKWFSRYFEKEIKFVHNPQSGFPDDTDAYGPTIVSSGSINEIAGWFSLTPVEIITRFRPNLIVGNTPPFWEDSLYGKAGEKIKFTIGSVSILGINPCNRCVVPSRNQNSSEQYPDFQKIFMEMREKTLPAWAERSRFNHFYKFCVNTQIEYIESGKIIKKDDLIIINKGDGFGVK